jgi:hypothetical protein
LTYSLARAKKFAAWASWMAQRNPFTVTVIPNLQQSRRRGLAFLECIGKREINAKRIYESLKTKQRVVANRFDYWLQGGKHDKFFHGLE